MLVLEKSSELTKSFNMPDYSEAVIRFSWNEARKMLDGLADGKLNIAHEAVDRHVAHGRFDVVALRWIAKDMQKKDFIYADLKHLDNRFSSVLETLGLSKTDRVFSLPGCVPELYKTVLGTLKAGCVYCRSFSAFGPEPVKPAMDIGKPAMLVQAISLDFAIPAAQEHDARNKSFTRIIHEHTELSLDPLGGPLDSSTNFDQAELLPVFRRAAQAPSENPLTNPCSAR